VRLQLRSDVPLGLFLSSGIDSGVLLAIMSRYSSGPVQAFTIGFEGGRRPMRSKMRPPWRRCSGRITIS